MMIIKGYEQIPGIDYHETYSPVVRFNTLRCLFAVAVKYDYDIDHLDVVTAFLNGDLEEDIYMEQPEEFIKRGSEGKVCKLKKAMYGLKQRAHAWNRKLHDVLTELGFKRSKIDQSLYIQRENNGSVVYLAVYVDDLLLFTNNQELKRTIIN